MDLPLIGPWTWIRQAHLTGPIEPHFYPLQVLFTCTFLVRNKVLGEGMKHNREIVSMSSSKDPFPKTSLRTPKT